MSTAENFGGPNCIHGEYELANRTIYAEYDRCNEADRAAWIADQRNVGRWRSNTPPAMPDEPKAAPEPVPNDNSAHIAYSPEAKARNESKYSQAKRDIIRAVDELDKAGFCPIPIPLNQKAPTTKDWQSIHMTGESAARHYGNDGGNVGSRNGAASNGRTDLDLDWCESCVLGSAVLTTLPSSGRVGKSNSHRWCISDGARTLKFSLPPVCKDDPRFGGEHGLTLLEIRSDGSQTVMPGSIHPSGERIEWTNGKPPSADELPRIDPGQLRKICALMALAALTMRCNPGEGGRNDTLLAFVGAAARIISDASMIDRLVSVICRAWGYTETVPQAGTTIEKLAAGDECVGLPRLCECLGLPDDVAKQINSKWLPSNDARPKVMLGASLNKMLDDLQTALKDASAPIYRQGARLVHVFRLDRDDTEDAAVRRKAGTLGIHPVSEHRLVQYMDKHVAFYTQGKDGPEPASFRSFAYLAKHLMERPELWSFSILNGIVEAPTIREDGTLLDKSGYDPVTGLVLDSGDLIVPPVLPNPTRDDAVAAMCIVCNVLLEFPFVTDNELVAIGTTGVQCESRSVAISGFLTGMTRSLLDRAPIHGVAANSIATGKSTLCNVISTVVTGRAAPAMTFPRDEDEAQKAFLSILMTGAQMIHIDNVERGQPVGGGVLAKITSEDRFSARVLGSNTNADVSTRVTWLINGNGLTLAADMASRAIKCDLDAGIENPQSRRFRRDILAYAKEHRGELIAALLTILRAHALAGQPTPGGITPSRFPQWDRVVRSAIIWCGEPDPYATAVGIDADDPEKGDVRALYAALATEFSDKEFTSADIIKAINGRAGEQGNQVLRGALAGRDGVPNGRTISLRLKAHDKVIVGGRRLRRRVATDHVVYFRVENLNGGSK